MMTTKPEMGAVHDAALDNEAYREHQKARLEEARRFDEEEARPRLNVKAVALTIGHVRAHEKANATLSRRLAEANSRSDAAFDDRVASGEFALPRDFFAYPR